MLVELEHSQWIEDRALDILGKLFACSFIKELGDVDTYLNVFLDFDNKKVEEVLWFSLKVGEHWITAKLPSILFLKFPEIEGSMRLIEMKVLPQIKHNPLYGEYIKLNRLQEDFQ